MTARTLFVGLGSPRGDDSVGWEAADRLRAIVPPHVVVHKARTPLAILDLLEECGMQSADRGMESRGPAFARMVICDASQGLGKPGEARRWGWSPIDGLVERAEVGALESAGPVCRSIPDCGPAPGHGSETRATTAGVIRDAEDLPPSRGGTHDFNLPQVLELATGLGRVPARVEIWTVEIGHSGPREALSPQVAAALPRLVREIGKGLC